MREDPVNGASSVEVATPNPQKLPGYRLKACRYDKGEFGHSSVQHCTEDAARLLLSQWLDALKTNDYDSFVAEVTPEVKAGLTSQMLEGVYLQVAPHMRKG